MAAKVLVAKTSFVTQVRGETVHVHAGQRVPSNHPLVKKREQLFEEVKDVDFEAPQRGGRKT